MDKWIFRQMDRQTVKRTGNVLNLFTNPFRNVTISCQFVNIIFFFSN